MALDAVTTFPYISFNQWMSMLQWPLKNPSTSFCSWSEHVRSWKSHQVRESHITAWPQCVTKVTSPPKETSRTVYIIIERERESQPFNLNPMASSCFNHNKSIYKYIYIYLRRGGRKPASKQMLRRRFFLCALCSVCCIWELCTTEINFRCWPFHHSNQSCCCGLEDYPRKITWRIFETLLFQGGWR